MKKTAIFEKHVELGAKIVQFAGFEMPVMYPGGIQKEYDAVRNRAGLFDVSHMGQLRFSGEGATEFLQFMTINNVSGLKPGEAQYSAMCYSDGGIVDDIILYRDETDYLMVVNASNIEKNIKWLQQNMKGKVSLSNESDKISLIALQGPDSRRILHQFTSEHLSLDFYTFTHTSIDGYPIMISRTGYTGELGYEIFGPSDAIVSVWDKLLLTEQVTAAGLAVRDILRMEMKYCLYGNDINETVNPIEAGLGWITDLTKTNFSGKSVLENVKAKKPTRRLVPFMMDERGIPRKDYLIS
ncbi:MAG: glycine cleavage system aminomethyltransferase GcvT, partial [Fidelibacterota bacterium]